MSDQTLKRAIMILATAVAYLLASRLADRLVDQPEVRGVRDDLKEGLLSAASSLAAHRACLGRHQACLGRPLVTRFSGSGCVRADLFDQPI